VKRTLRTLAVLLAGYALLTLPGLAWPSYFDSPAAWLVLVPGLSIYFFHKIGVPGLLEHNGLCGWGMCAPTVFGWVFLVAFWLAFAFLVAWGIAALTLRFKQRGGAHHAESDVDAP
jgi:hypothetical protein